MRRLPLSLLLAALAVGCGKDAPAPKPAPAPAEADATPAEGNTPQVADARVDQRWSGEVTLPGDQTLAFTAHLRAEPGEAARGTIDIPVQGVQAMELRDVKVTGDVVAFTLATPGPEAGWAHFEARREGDGLAKGTLKQGPATLPLTMRTLADGELPADAPPQTPRPPYPYEAREVTVQNPNDQVTLAGTLTMPEGDGPHPAVVLLTGSGPQDRDETLFGHKPFLVLADHLTRAGVAVLRLDDRGVGGSQGDLASTPLDVLAADARAAVMFLDAQPGIDRDAVGLLGHSEGGAVAALAASDLAEIDFVVMLAGPAVPGRELLSSQLAAMMRGQGASDEVVDKHLALQKAVLDALADGKDAATLRAAVDALVEAQVTDSPNAAQIPPEARKELVDAHAAAVSSEAFRSVAMHDPTESLERLKVPVLALFGAKDIQVPAEANAKALRELLEAAEHTDFTIEIVEGANHLFQTAETGGVDEYARLKETLKPEVLERVTQWITARAKGSAKGGGAGEAMETEAATP